MAEQEYSPVDEHKRRMLSLEVRKAELEAAKLELDVQEQRRPVWARSSFIIGSFPILIAIGAVFTGWFNGAFEGQAKLLEAKRERLQLDVAKFEDQRNELQTSIADLKRKTFFLSIDLNESQSVVEFHKVQERTRKELAERLSLVIKPITEARAKAKEDAKSANNQSTANPLDTDLKNKASEADARYLTLSYLEIRLLFEDIVKFDDYTLDLRTKFEAEIHAKAQQFREENGKKLDLADWNKNIAAIEFQQILENSLNELAKRKSADEAKLNDVHWPI